MARISRVVLAMVVGALLFESGCRRSTSGVAQQGGGAVPTASSVQVVAGAGRRLGGEKAGETVAIPPGRFFAGSVPGDEGRDPTIEPVAATYDLPGFTIDALPYPGKPGEPPRTGVSQAEASKLCAERGARLCTELEWERACRGPNGDPFSSGTAWDPTCAKTPEQCVSGFGVRSMGSALEEWTASALAEASPTAGPRLGPAKRFVVKGASGAASPSAHRCAARRASDPSGGGRPTGFRCCSGPAPSVSVAAIESAPAFRRGAVEAGKLAEILAGIPELSRLKGVRFFKDSEAAEVTEKAKNPPGAGWTLTAEPIVWSPVAGTEILVATGKSKGGAFVVALHRLHDAEGERYRLASSMIFANEQGPVLLAYQGNIRREIVWSMAWGAAGEGGAVTYRDDHRVVIVQR
ncbi:MAG: SUMF1/EgtB/PvdO family nonheme iron enzyme [Deltaproteobacteria bacterium]|nr:SUMF1/EgtB/PvdO family nonheme iron enzyme [Deltaproteobacteria bacterium]